MDTLYLCIQGPRGLLYLGKRVRHLLLLHCQYALTVLSMLWTIYSTVYAIHESALFQYVVVYALS